MIKLKQILSNNRHFGFRIFREDGRNALHENFFTYNEAIEQSGSLKEFLDQFFTKAKADVLIVKYGRKSGYQPSGKRRYRVDKSIKVEAPKQREKSPKKPIHQKDKQMQDTAPAAAKKNAENTNDDSFKMAMLNGVKSQFQAEFLTQEKNRLEVENRDLKSKLETSLAEKERLTEANRSYEWDKRDLSRQITDLQKDLEKAKEPKEDGLDKMLKFVSEKPEALGSIISSFKSGAASLAGGGSDNLDEVSKALLSWSKDTGINNDFKQLILAAIQGLYENQQTGHTQERMQAYIKALQQLLSQYKLITINQQ